MALAVISFSVPFLAFGPYDLLWFCLVLIPPFPERPTSGYSVAPLGLLSSEVSVLALWHSIRCSFLEAVVFSGHLYPRRCCLGVRLARIPSLLRCGFLRRCLTCSPSRWCSVVWGWVFPSSNQACRCDFCFLFVIYFFRFFLVSISSAYTTGAWLGASCSLA